MNIASVSKLTGIENSNIASTLQTTENRNKAFEDIFQAAVNMFKETNSLENAAEQAEISYALGLTDNTHDLQIAQQKANIAIQYTVAIRNSVLDAYKEIMNLQF